MPEEIIAHKFDDLLWGDQHQVNSDTSPQSQHAFIASCLSEAVSEAFVHELSGRTRLLVLEPRLDETDGRHAERANHARDTSVDHLRQEWKV